MGAKGDAEESGKGVSLTGLGLKVVPAEDGAGVMVTEVAPDSPAAERGLKAGDIIVEVAGSEVHSPSDVRDALKSTDKKRVLMLIKTQEGQRFIALPTAQG